MSWRRWLVVTHVHCGQTVHPRTIVTMELIGTPTPGIQWYRFRPPGVTPNRGMGLPWGAFCQITLTSCLFWCLFLKSVCVLSLSASSIGCHLCNYLFSAARLDISVMYQWCGFSIVLFRLYLHVCIVHMCYRMIDDDADDNAAVNFALRCGLMMLYCRRSDGVSRTLQLCVMLRRQTVSK